MSGTVGPPKHDIPMSEPYQMLDRSRRSLQVIAHRGIEFAFPRVERYDRN